MLFYGTIIIIIIVLEDLEKINEAEEFIDRVEKERAPDYDSIIENPMYLNRMKQKIKKGDYDTPQEVCNYVCMFHPHADLESCIIMPSLCN